MSSKRINRVTKRPASVAPAAVLYPRLAAGFGLLLLSAAGMAFEVILTHLFSIVFQYHFAFLAVSTAILGLGIGAVISFRSKRPLADRLPEWLSRTAAVLGMILLLAVILFNLAGFVPGYLLQILIGLCPFVVIGRITAYLYELFDKDAAWLYAFDLVGAAAGLVGALVLLNLMSASSVGFVLALLAAAAGLIFSLGKRKRLLVPAGSFAIIAAGLVVNLLAQVIDLPLAASGSAPPDKTMFQMIADPTSKARIVDSAWSSFARVDLVAGSDPNQMYAFTNAGAGSYMLKFDGDLSQVSWLKTQVEYLPFLNFTPQNTLILGAGAGKDVLQALLAGSQNITAVEINPAMVAITRKHADFNGGILDYPGVTTVVADGREYLDNTANTYDMIYMNLVYAQAPSPGSNALSEAYIFTTQAFKLYWDHLAPDGRLAIVAHQGLEGARSMITALQALQDEGIAPQDALRHAALLMYNASDPNQATTVFILQKPAFTVDVSTSLEKAGYTAGMVPLFLSGVYEPLFSDLASGYSNLSQFLVQKDYNLFPTTDERPFFFNLNPGLPQPLIILLVIAGGVLLLYLLFMAGSSSKPTGAQMVYFGGLGLGYILIEVPLIQRTLLLVGSPTLAMVAVLATLMITGGIASFLSSRWNVERLWRKIAIAALILGIFAAALALLQPRLLSALALQPLSARILLGVVSLIPLGLLMGIPFANGLRLGGLRSKRTLPYLWGWNAVTSVAGSALAASLAMWAGFSISILAGAACYIIVGLMAWLQSRQS